MADVNTGTNWTCYDSSTMTAREIYGRTLAELAGVRRQEKTLNTSGGTLTKSRTAQ